MTKLSPRLALIPVLSLLTSVACGVPLDGGSCSTTTDCRQDEVCIAESCMSILPVDGAGCEGPAAATNPACAPSPVAVYVTAATGRGVHVLDVGAEGVLRERRASPAATQDGQTAEIAVSADGRHAYVAKGRNGGVAVHAFDVHPRTGDLELNPFPQMQTGSGLQEWRSVTVDPMGAYVFAADRGPDSQRVYTFAIDSERQPGRLTQAAYRQDIPVPERVVAEPSGRFVYVLGGSRDVGIYRINRDPAAEAPMGALIPVAELRLDFFATDLEVGAQGDALYVVGRRSGAGDFISAFEIDPVTGGLHEIAGDFVPTPNAQRIEVDPAGRFVWVLSRTAVFTYRVTPNTGTLGVVDADRDPINGTTGFEIDEARDLVVAANGKQMFVVARGATHTLGIGSDGRLKTSVPPLGVGGDRIALFSRRP